MSTRYFLRMINPHLHSIDDLVPRTRVRTGRLHLHRFEHSSECCVAYSHLEEAEFHRRPSQTWMPPSVLGTWTTSSVCTEVGSYTQDDMLRILEHSETAHVGESFHFRTTLEKPFSSFWTSQRRLTILVEKRNRNARQRA